MPADAPLFDVGLLSPATAGHEGPVSDAAVLAALVEAEIALIEAYDTVGALGSGPERVAALVQARRLREVVPASSEIPASSDHPGGSGPRNTGSPTNAGALDPRALALGGVAGGNPVIPLVTALRRAAGSAASPWVHRGATSQDILDTALMIVARDAVAAVLGRIDAGIDALGDFAEAHRDEVAVARTLTQHAVPTTVGLRAANWRRGLQRARARLAAARDALPAQLGGAGGTLASFVEILGPDRAARMPAAFAEAAGLAVPDAPWHTARWPVTELGDALVQILDALGVIAADVATLSRTEIGELSEPSAGGSPAMPQTQNPARSVLIRSAALRAPHLGATLHTAAGLAVDERPDGAWHVEWPTLRELLRLALGAGAHASDLLAGLRADSDAVARNLSATRGLIVAERLSVALGPVIGRRRVGEIVQAAGSGGDLGLLVHHALEESGSDLRVDDLLDPARYIGLAPTLFEKGEGADAPPTHASDEGSAAPDARGAEAAPAPTAQDPARDDRPGPYDPFATDIVAQRDPRPTGFDPFADPFTEEHR